MRKRPLAAATFVTILFTLQAVADPARLPVSISVSHIDPVEYRQDLRKDAEYILEEWRQLVAALESRWYAEPESRCYRRVVIRFGDESHVVGLAYAVGLDEDQKTLIIEVELEAVRGEPSLPNVKELASAGVILEPSPWAWVHQTAKTAA